MPPLPVTQRMIQWPLWGSGRCTAGENTRLVRYGGQGPAVGTTGGAAVPWGKEVGQPAVTQPGALRSHNLQP